MDAERRGQQYELDRDRPGRELTVPAAVEIRRKRVQQATRMGGALLSALSKRPSRLFDNNDGALTMMLWGVEKST